MRSILLEVRVTKDISDLNNNQKANLSRQFTLDKRKYALFIQLQPQNV